MHAGFTTSALSSAGPKNRRSAWSREDIAPCSAEDEASCSEAPPDAHPNPALNSVAGDLLSAVCQWSMKDVLLVGAVAEEKQGVEEAYEAYEAEETQEAEVVEEV